MPRTINATLQTELDKFTNWVIHYASFQFGGGLATQTYAGATYSTGAGDGINTTKRVVSFSEIALSLEPKTVGGRVDIDCVLVDHDLAILANIRASNPQARDLKVFRAVRGVSNTERLLNGTILGVHPWGNGLITIRGQDIGQQYKTEVGLQVTRKRFPYSKPEDDFV